MPYGVWPFELPTPESTVRMGGIGYDAERQVIYMSQLWADRDGYAYRPVIHAVKVNKTPVVSDRTSAVSLSADSVAPQMAGTPIVMTAQPVGGKAPHQYKWFSHKDGVWTLLSAWSESSSITWTPAVAAADARVGVWVQERRQQRGCARGHGR